jgi:hypothetical protein
MNSYTEFLQKKAQLSGDFGFEPLWLPDCLMGFQRVIVEWWLRKGRGACFADCGLGKSLMELVCAENVVRKTNRPALILTPLAVASQFVREGEKFGVECHKVRGGKWKPGINVTNYQQLHHYNPDDFAFVSGDESGCIKDFESKTRDEVTEFFRRIPYRLLATATPSPNDFVELGTSSEALGSLGWRDMITQFFKQETKKDYLGWGRTKYRLKGWADEPFWKWVCSWARACRKPSDLGFEDGAFILPELIERDHMVKARTLPEGFLFDVPASNMQEERAERRRTINERCEKAAELVNDTGKPAVVWCHLNDEGDLLEKLIPDAKQIAGSDADEAKEERYDAFATGQVRVLVIKPKIGAWGLNWQHCAHAVTFVSHSYEQRYQAIRRCWRFGQKQPVVIDTISTEGEQRVAKNLQRKAEAADRMFTALVAHMNDAMAIRKPETTNGKIEVPAWLEQTASRNGTHSTKGIAVK